MLNVMTTTRPKKTRTLCAATATAFLLSTFAAGAIGIAKPDESDIFFAARHVPKIVIEITGKDLNDLRANNRAYVRCTVREDDKRVYDFVGVHLKGAAGSFRGLDDRPALSLNFDKFRKNQVFHGMDKIHLNNSVQDGTYLNEAICRSIFNDAGIAAGRGSHAIVILNGRNLGLYTLTEGFDHTFVKRHYKNPDGILYDGGFCQDLDGQKKVISNTPHLGQPELKALWQAAHEPDVKKRFEKISTLVDIDHFLKFIALELMTAHWDGYCQNRNNYRIYTDTVAKKTYLMPSGMDQMFGDPNFNLFGGVGGTVANQLLNTPEGKTRYRQVVGSLYTNVFRPEILGERIDEMAEKLAPHGDFRGHAAGLKQRITARANVIANQLGVPPPAALKFDNNQARISNGWEPKIVSGTATHAKRSIEGRGVLYVRVEGEANVSWRKNVLLAPGNYFFEGRVRTANVKGTDDLSTAAGLRVSGQKRALKIDGSKDWQPFRYEISVGGMQEVSLVCELISSTGEAWFDLESLKLIRR